ncbi:hypothetical protein PRIPAC_91309, partial [Pristionchus pacificus]|uniref:G protein-coupled receptor n=1 Tax=Pristionchus pacificus TaxID=54126 RepID=A0A2A6B637_PRIPA
IVNLIFSLDFCFIQAPAATGVLFAFYEALGPYIAKVEMIKTTTIIQLGSVFHFVLALSRFTAIARPSQHATICRKLSRICFALWLITFALSVPLLLPGSTDYLITTNVFRVPGIEFTFLGNYFLIYSIGSSSVGAFMEVITIACYVGMTAKFREFKNLMKAGSNGLQRMNTGVIRTTVAAMCSSMGSWIIVFFFLVGLLYPVLSGNVLIRPMEFSAVFGLLNTINNILTPWVLVIMFPNVRKRLFGVACAVPHLAGSSG